MKYILYHSNCPDGFGSAFAMFLVHGNSETKYMPVTHGVSLPKEFKEGLTKDDQVFICDFSFDVNTLKELNSICKTIVLDHHITAEKAIKDSGCEYVFDINRSGSTITFDYLSKANLLDSKRRRFFEYLEDRDLWKFILPGSRAISAWIMSYEYNLDVWFNCLLQFQCYQGVCEQQGAAILRSNIKNTSMICDNSKEIQIYAGAKEPYSVAIVNATSHWSEVGEALLKKHPNVGISLSYYKDNNNKWKFSMRSLPDIDCTPIAKFFGGGGHKNAAGFQLNNLKDLK